MDIEVAIANVAKFDQWVGLQLELSQRFGVRAKEARQFRPHGALVLREHALARDANEFPECAEFVRFDRGTKGGRSRDVPLQTAEQRELLERVQRVVPDGWFVGDPSRSDVQSANRFYNVLQRFGITRANSGVTAHGLRHEYANNLYEQDTGEPSPVRGQETRPANDIDARRRTAIALGHARVQSSAFYVGTLKPKPASDDEPTEPTT